MVKSLKKFTGSGKETAKLLATNPTYKQGLLTGMLLTKKIFSKHNGSGKIRGGKMTGGSFVDFFRKALQVAAGPFGWMLLVNDVKDKKMQELKDKLKEEHPDKVKEIEDFGKEMEYYDDDEYDDDEYDDEYDDDDDDEY